MSHGAPSGVPGIQPLRLPIYGNEHSSLPTWAQDALVRAAREILDAGTHEFWARSVQSMGVVNAAFKTR